MSTVGERYRLVTLQDGREHVSSIVLSDEEAQEQLHADADLHEATGWRVDRIVDATGRIACFLASRTHEDGICSRRLVGSRRYSPMEDA